MGCFLLAQALRAQGQPADTAVVLGTEGVVEVFPYDHKAWTSATNGHVLRIGDQVRTGPRSRATVRLSNLSILRVSESMRYEIAPPRDAGGKPVIDIKAGSMYFFSRDRPQEIQLRTPIATGAIRGTEFNVTVGSDGRTELTLLNGEVELFNTHGSVVLTNIAQAVVTPGNGPVTRAISNVLNVIQWNLYYPAVLDPKELRFSLDEEQELKDSIAAYRIGNLPLALRTYPPGRLAISAVERIYLGQLLLAVGLVEQTETQLTNVDFVAGDALRLADALRQLLSAVKRQERSATHPLELASEWLAESYYRQSRLQLPEALVAARKAVEKSPRFGLGWARVAELEFGFGRIREAIVALDKSFESAPSNPQAVALKGFLLSAENRISEATKYFDRAIVLDGALANAWLGRGLCRIRQGRAVEGRADLLVAAALEPHRSVLRSYLGKAFGDAGDDLRAAQELKLARDLDSQDPTSWLYSALLKQQQNQINDATADLENSQTRHDNRRLFRSLLLLDKDRAVGGANLASIYRDAGMTDVSVREAARAVTYDYANASAHLFLSDAYNDLRDPTRFNLRYETVWFNELLLANLLAPVGGGRLAQQVSQQEYSRLFEADGFHLASQSDLRSDGIFHQQASQFGTFKNTSYALDLDYQHHNGVRPNNDLNSIEWYSTVKHQVSPQDSALLLVKYENYHSGDNFQYYDPATRSRPNFRFDEYQDPILVAGWHHEWSPGIHTLFLGGRLANEQHFSDRAAPQLVLDQFSDGTIYGTESKPYDVNYQNNFTIYTGEVNQICQWNHVNLSAGARYQSGTFHTMDQFSNATPPTLFTSTAESATAGFERIAAYGYLTIEPVDRLWLTGGLTYDTVRFPQNFRHPPVFSGEDRRSQVSPKAAIVWNPVAPVTVRGIYTRSLGGVSLDESYRLEPTQLAGFPQTFRSLIPESVVGSVSAPTFETRGLALDLKLGPRTYAGFEVAQRESTVDRNIGVFILQNGVTTGFTPERLDYQERTLGVSLNQLVGDHLALGTSYRLLRADLHDALPAVPVAVLPAADQQLRSTLHQASGYVLLNHPSGFFGKAETRWYHGDNAGYTPALAASDFWQHNLYAGWRFAHRRAELALGILNLTGQDYRLNPLASYQELPRERVFQVRLNFQF